MGLGLARFVRQAVEIARKSFSDVEYKDSGMTMYYNELKDRGGKYLYSTADL